MRRLYSTQSAKPLSMANGRPSRLAFSTVDWCEGDDLVAVVSGCGGVAVYHADAPGEVAMLVATRRAPARHVVWRRVTPDKPPLLAVADAACRVTFWAARDRRVNVWETVGVVEVPSSVEAMGWTTRSSALVAVLAHGSVATWLVPNEPAPLDLPRRAQTRSHHPLQRGPGAQSHAQVRALSCKNNKLESLFKGAVECAHVAPSEQDEMDSVAIVTVPANEPAKLCVWQVTLNRQTPSLFDVRSLNSAELNAEEDGKCMACVTVPKLGFLFAIGDKGTISRYFYFKPNSWMLQSRKNIVDVELQSSQPAVDGANSRRKKIYSLAVTLDGEKLVTSSEAGLTIRKISDLSIIESHPLKTVKDKFGDDKISPYWGAAFSPSGSAIAALNGEGVVDTFTLVNPIMIQKDNKESSANANKVAESLVKWSSRDGLRGIWDVQASIVADLPYAAMLVVQHLNIIHAKTKSNEQLENLRFTMLGFVDPHNVALLSARRLLDNAVNAIRKSASDAITSKMDQPDGAFKNPNTQVIATHVANATKQLPKPLPSELAAVPLADWIMLLSAVWLRRCACVAYCTQNVEPLMAPVWTKVVKEERQQSPQLFENKDRARGILRDPQLLKRIRHAATAAFYLLSLEETYREPDADPRYLRFSMNECADIVTALWEISLSWSSISDNGANRQQAAVKQYTCAAQALNNHQIIAHVLLNNDKLRILAAEQALGLHGSAMGAGFLMSYVRNRKESGPNGAESSGSTAPEKKTSPEWCPYDLVTGRPLPPWAPLRRCVLSGLLAAEVTMPSADGRYSANAPWAEHWVHESPFGGRWARVPSLDLDRYELLPAAPNPTTDAAAAQRSMSRDMLPIPATSDALVTRAAAQNAAVQAAAAAQNAANANAGNMPMPTAAAAAAQAAAAAAAAAAGAVPSSRPMPGATGRVPGAQQSRIQASPGVSATTADGGEPSVVSKTTKRRGSTPNRGGRAAKRPKNGEPTVSGEFSVGSIAAPDALSSDTRSTAATNATGGVDQPTRTRRKGRTKKNAAANSNHNGAAAQHHAGMNLSGTPGSHATGAVNPGLTPSRQTATPPGNSMQRNINPQNVAAAAAAAEAAAKALGRGAMMQSNKSGLGYPMLGDSSIPGAAPDLMGQAARFPRGNTQGVRTSVPSPSGSAMSAQRPASMMNPIPPQNIAMSAALSGNVRPPGMPNGSEFSHISGGAGIGNPFLDTSPASMANAAAGFPGAPDFSQFQNMQNMNPQMQLAIQTLSMRKNAQLQAQRMPNAAAAAAAAALNPNAGATMNGVNNMNNPAAFMQGLGAMDGMQPPNTQAAMARMINLGGVPGAPNQMQLAAQQQRNAMLNGMGAANLGAGLNGGLDGAAMNNFMGQNGASATAMAAAALRGGNMGMQQLNPNNPLGAANMMNLAGGMGGMPPNGSGAGSAASNLTPGQRIWTGNLHVRGHRNDMVVPCVAMRFPTPARPSVNNATGWPAQIHCDSSKLKQCASVFQYINEPTSQWYVRFAPVDGDGNEIVDPKLVQLVKVMVTRQLAFEIECGEGTAQRGTLYLWGMPMPPRGHSLLGVFRPHPQHPHPD